MTKKSGSRIKISADSDGFSDYARNIHARAYVRNGVQFIMVSQELFKLVGMRTGVYWYLRGMAIELLIKGLLYESDKATYSPAELKAMNHDLAKLWEELEKKDIVSLTNNETKAINSLNRFYYDNKNHVLRYPSILEIFTPLTPSDEEDEYIYTLLGKLLSLVDGKNEVK